MGRTDPVTDGAFRLHRFDVLQSTQIEAGNGQYQVGDVVIAETQTGSYGRRGRSWQAPIGNLYFTMVEKFQDYGQLGWLPYAVGLALYDAIVPDIANQDALRLKWPNDVLLDGNKISGVLIEVKNEHLLIGIGVNVTVKPRTDQPVACVNDYSTRFVSSDHVLSSFLKHYTHWFEVAEKTGFSGLKADWIKRAAFVNEMVTARLANGQVIQGLFESLDEQGALVLRTEKAHHVITSADIFLNNTDSTKTEND